MDPAASDRVRVQVHHLPSALAALGGLAKAVQLLDRGFTYRQLSAAVAAGEIVRVRQGWYVLEDDGSPWIDAVRVGGRLACVSAAVEHGLWALDARRPHVQVPPDARELRSAADRQVRQRIRHDAVVHWVPDAVAHAASDPRRHEHPDAPPVPVAAAVADPRRVAPVLECLVQLARCRPWDEAVAVWDSAVHARRITAEELESALSALGGELERRMRADLDPTAESGLESMLRVPLRRAGLAVRTQVERGPYRTDIELRLPSGAWIDVECDGEAWHASARKHQDDRVRDAFITTAGGWALRFTGAQIIAQRGAVLDAIAAAVHRLAPHHAAAGRLRDAAGRIRSGAGAVALRAGARRRRRVAPAPSERPGRERGAPTRPRLTPWAFVPRVPRPARTRPATPGGP